MKKEEAVSTLKKAGIVVTNGKVKKADKAKAKVALKEKEYKKFNEISSDFHHIVDEATNALQKLKLNKLSPEDMVKVRFYYEEQLYYIMKDKAYLTRHKPSPTK